ncbi:MAG: DUF6132 family protein [Elusimicrobiota bacterium]
MTKMILGVVGGGVLGYLWYRAVGCSTGTCPLTSNPYVSTLYGAVLGILMTSATLSGGKPELFQRLAVTQAAELATQTGTLILDVRTPQEYTQGRLPNAVLLPIDELSHRQGELPKDKRTPVLVYCATGRRSQAAARFLTEQGYTAVQELKGGITAWQAEGRPVAR